MSRSTLHSCLRLMLRPVVRFCFRRALKLQEFLDVTKQVFFEVATEELRSGSKAASTSKVALATGLTRREATRLAQEENAPEPAMNILTRIIGKWQSHPDFTNKKGEPIILSCEGKDSQFAALVASVTKDLNPYTALFELERVGAVERKGDKVALEVDVYVPSASVEEGFRILSRDSSDLIAAVEGNVVQQISPPHLHIRTHYDNIAVEHLPEIRSWLLEEGTKFHARVREFLALHDKDLNPRLVAQPGGARVALSAFSFTEEKPAQGHEVQKKGRR
ncbi:MAG: hypothetical protein J0M12_00275 [Deltaproteobacteria bacterium]|nr:hypothetical protein [Deltaproteobacteria bacterium]